MKNKYIYATETASQIKKSNCILIYGAGVVACQVANCLHMEPYNMEIDAFVVTDASVNVTELMGKRVISVKEVAENYSEALVLVAVLEKYYADIHATLDEYGIKNVIPLTFESDLWAAVRGNVFRRICIDKYGSYKTLDDELKTVSNEDNNGDIHIYSAKCHLDRPLETSKEYPWEYDIQVGTYFADEIVCGIQDNTGENISDKNRSYCELTALYWIWKNDKSKYAGLGHYRRHFALMEEQVASIGKSDIDVVLPVPIFNFPNVRLMYQHDHYIQDWDIMLEIVKELQPDYYQTAIDVEKGIYYYAYNMLIARKEILDEYCAWLFPILEKCHQECPLHGDKYQERVIGFLAERLLTIFFIHNWRRWNIVHAEKNFLE